MVVFTRGGPLNQFKEMKKKLHIATLKDMLSSKKGKKNLVGGKHWHNFPNAHTAPRHTRDHIQS